MSTGSQPLAHIILAGLELAAQESLGRVLKEQGHQVTIGWQPSGPRPAPSFAMAMTPLPGVGAPGADAAADMPVIAVTKLPESGKWLDALEAGAADYCSAPFETMQICWLLAAVQAHATQRTPHAADRGGDRAIGVKIAPFAKLTPVLGDAASRGFSGATS